MHQGKKKLFILHAALGAATLVPSLVEGATWTWIGSGGSIATPASGAWNVAGNWSSAGGDTPSDASTTALLFGGSGSTPYTATNDTGTDVLTFGTLALNSSASVTHVITGDQPDDNTSRTIEQLGSGAFTISMPINQNNNALTLTGNGSGIVTIIGAVTGDGGSNGMTVLTKSGTSTYVLTSTSNDNWDAVNITGGLLRLGSSGANGTSGTNITIGTGAMLGLDSNFNVASTINSSSTGIIALNANNSSLNAVGGLFGSSSAFIGSLGDFTLNPSSLAPGSSSVYRLGGGGGTLTVSGTNLMQDTTFFGFPVTRSLVVGSTQANGGGVVVLVSANSYTGGTQVNAGKLLVNSTGGTGSGAVVVNSGATLGGAGTITGATTISGSGSGGTLAPGASVGKLTFTADITLQTGSFFEIELGAPGTAGVDYDQVEVQGTNNEFTTGGAKLKLVLMPGIAPGTYTIVNATAGANVIAGALLRNLDGTLMDDNVTTYSQSGVNFKIDYSSGGVNLIISAVPEPSALGLLMLVAPTLLRRRRRT